MTKLSYDYIKPEGDVTRHTWTAVGPNGAVHIWAQPNVQEIRERWGEVYYGGVEVHSPKPMYDFGDGKPHHENCWLLKAPCWHDGSSLYFSENIEPIIRAYKGNMPPDITEYINSILHDWYGSKFGKRCEEIQ